MSDEDEMERQFRKIAFAQRAMENVAEVEPATAEEIDAIVRRQLGTMPAQVAELERIADGNDIEMLIGNELGPLTRSFGYLSQLPIDFLRSLFWDSDNESAVLLRRFAAGEDIGVYGATYLVRQWTRCIIYLQEFNNRKELGEWE